MPWQLARAEAAAAAAAVERFPDGSALRPARDAAEAAWARGLAAAGREFRSGALLAVAAEALMNVSPWDYYQARPALPYPRACKAGCFRQAAWQNSRPAVGGCGAACHNRIEC